MYYVISKLDFTNPELAFYVVISFFAVHAIIFLIMFIIKNKITASKDKSPVIVEGEKITVMEYDNSQLRKYFFQVMIGLIIAGVMLYYKIIAPLLIQSLLNPYNLFTNTLFRYYIRGDRSEEIMKRPWKEESAFGALTDTSNATSSSEPEEPEMDPSTPPDTMDSLAFRSKRRAPKNK